ncbi:MAG TPA: hypothetical protein VG916_13160, partial [Gemmatimonadaceae bacterium]|nr:hypothetical protein [Gemmatimonadaceae bacterium]
MVDLRSRSQAFRLPDAAARAFEAATPPGWETWVVSADTDSSGDGSQAPSAEALEAIAEAEVYLGYGLPRALFAAARRLAWVHTGTAGVASMLYPEMVESAVVVTNSVGGIYGPPIAEHVVGGVLHFLRAFDIAGAQQRAARW